MTALVSIMLKALVADGTCVWAFTTVDSFMQPETRSTGEIFTTLTAGIQLSIFDSRGYWGHVHWGGCLLMKQIERGGFEDIWCYVHLIIGILLL